jgi:glycosyltransferase involved in cell wall biosynthesis
MNDFVAVSVITPTIPGREHYLTECIQSVFAQTVHVSEHLIRAAIPVEGRNQAVDIAVGRNVVASASQQPWLMFLDDDDRLLPTYFEEMLSELYKRHPADIIYAWDIGDPGSVAPGTTVGPTIPWVDLSEVPCAERMRRIENKEWVLPITAVVRAEKFWSVGGWPVDYDYEAKCFPSGTDGEDQELWWRMFAAGATVRCIHKPLWSYRRRDRDIVEHMKLEDDGKD